MELVLFFAFTTLLAFAFAKVEVAIEGAHGWAESLPTWQLTREKWQSKLFFGNKPATGYHAWMNFFVVAFAHLPYLFIPVSLSIECKLVAFIIFFFIIEDFLWFMVNPSFGLKNFRKEKIWWHAPNWWLIMPRDYVLGVLSGGSLYALSVFLS